MGETPLHWAALEDLDQIVSLLVDKGADVNIPDKDGCAPKDLGVEKKKPGTSAKEKKNGKSGRK